MGSRTFGLGCSLNRIETLNQTPQPFKAALYRSYTQHLTNGSEYFGFVVPVNTSDQGSLLS